VRHADAIDAELRSAREEIDALRVARSGHTRMGCGPSEATRLLPTALGRLHASSPGIRVTILYGLNQALMPMVKHGEVDFALSSIPARCQDSDLRRLHIHEDRAAVIARRGHPLLSRRDALTAADLVDQQWITSTEHELERLALDQVFTDAGFAPPQNAIETTSAILMKTMAMQSDFLTFLPRELIYWEERAGLLSPINLIAPPWRRHVGITLRARAVLNPAAESLIKTLQGVGKEFFGAGGHIPS
jgi:DNA-binding transcriptional LysR family regulator